MKRASFIAAVICLAMLMALCLAACTDENMSSSSSSSISAGKSSSSLPSSPSYSMSPSSSNSASLPGSSSSSAASSGSSNSTGNSSTGNSSSAAAMGTDFEEIGALSAASLDWGPGGPKDSKNRSQSALMYNTKYGAYNAVFIAEESPNVYLTFDEGYEYGLTGKILDTLKEKGVKALFFVTGDFAKSEHDLIRRMIDEGHLIGSHSWGHKNYSSLTPAQISEDLTKLSDYIYENFDYEMKYFRFPSGNFSEQALASVAAAGYKSVFWSFAYVDWLTDKQPEPVSSCSKIVSAACPGMIYLLHSVSKTNADILGDVIDQVRAQGYVWADPSLL